MRTLLYSSKRNLQWKTTFLQKLSSCLSVAAKKSENSLILLKEDSEREDDLPTKAVSSCISVAAKKSENSLTLLKEDSKMKDNLPTKLCLHAL